MWLAEYSLSERTRALITRLNVRIRNLTPHVLNHFCEKNRIYLFDSNGSSQTLNTSVNVTLVIVKNRLFSSFCSIFESIKNELTTEGHQPISYLSVCMLSVTSLCISRKISKKLSSPARLRLDNNNK